MKWKKIAAISVLLAIAAAGILVYAIETSGASPRLLAPYIVRRVTQHNPVVVGIGNFFASRLIAADRGVQHKYDFATFNIGAQDNPAILNASKEQSTRNVHVVSTEEVLRAIAEARPGDSIILAPGTYHFRGTAIDVRRPGTKDMRITVQAEKPNTVTLNLATSEGFLVTAPFWTFENLTVRGACKQQFACEHAFHIVGEARHFIARNNTIVDFNAHFKINRFGEKFPDEGLIEGNTLTNRSVRNTYSSVTPIDLVAASGWIIRRNLITDFIKGQSDQISYGAFAKGAGADTRFEQNMVICENQLKGAPGRRVGLSLGGGGTKDSFCRDGRCIVEQERGVLEANLIASCSDEGIYINRGARSRIIHNTLLDTAGITVRYPESSADIEGNLVDASIRSRDDGLMRKTDNFETSLVKIYAGMHPVRDLFRLETSASFLWTGDPPRRSTTSDVPVDMCGEKRPGTPAYGAFEQFQACMSKGRSS